MTTALVATWLSVASYAETKVCAQSLMRSDVTEDTGVDSSLDGTNRLAVVIGNNDYENLPLLKNAVADARLMAKTLRELHFHVVCVLNADRGAMGEAISVIEERLVKDTVVLFYFAGHGFSSNGEN